MHRFLLVSLIQVYLSQENILFADYNIKNNVIRGDPKVVKELREEYEYSVVYYHSAHCTHCHKFSPQFNKIAVDVKEDMHSVPLI